LLLLLSEEFMNLPMKSTVGFAAILVLLAIAPGTAPPNTGREQDVVREQENVIRSLEGATLYHAYCAVCHGVNGKGGGPAASALKTTPPDLTQITRRNGGPFPALRVQKIISGEEAATPAHGSREMPIWGPIFGQIAWDQDLGKVRVYNLSKYLESLQQK
jgi:mono/diheme cytochrome c family protein